MQKRNYAVDTFRGIACIMVVLIHYPFPGCFGGIIKALCRAAVPFFFLTSGYFTNRHTVQKTTEQMPGRLVHLLKICLVAAAFCIAAEYVVFYRGVNPINVLAEAISLQNVMRFVLFNDTGNITHLWFLFALLYCNLLLLLILKLNLKHFYLIDLLAGCLMIVGIIMAHGGIMFHIQIDNTFYRNAIFDGFPMFWLGYRFAKVRFSKIKWIPVMCSGMFLTLIEYLISGNIELTAGTMLLAVGAFQVALNSSYDRNNCLAILGKKYSLLVYVLHWYVICVEYKLISTCVFLQASWYAWISPVMVVLYSIISAILVKYVWNHIRGVRYGRN